MSLHPGKKRKAKEMEMEMEMEIKACTEKINHTQQVEKKVKLEHAKPTTGIMEKEDSSSDKLSLGECIAFHALYPTMTRHDALHVNKRDGDGDGGEEEGENEKKREREQDRDRNREHEIGIVIAMDENHVTFFMPHGDLIDKKFFPTTKIDMDTSTSPALHSRMNLSLGRLGPFQLTLYYSTANFEPMPCPSNIFSIQYLNALQDDSYHLIRKQFMTGGLIPVVQHIIQIDKDMSSITISFDLFLLDKWHEFPRALMNHLQIVRNAELVQAVLTKYDNFIELLDSQVWSTSTILGLSDNSSSSPSPSPSFSYSSLSSLSSSSFSSSSSLPSSSSFPSSSSSLPSLTLSSPLSPLSPLSHFSSSRDLEKVGPISSDMDMDMDTITPPSSPNSNSGISALTDIESVPTLSNPVTSTVTNTRARSTQRNSALNSDMKLKPYQQNTVEWMRKKESTPYSCSMAFWLPVVTEPMAPVVFYSPFFEILSTEGVFCDKRGGIIVQGHGMGKKIQALCMVYGDVEQKEVSHLGSHLDSEQEVDVLDPDLDYDSDSEYNLCQRKKRNNGNNNSNSNSNSNSNGDDAKKVSKKTLIIASNTQLQNWCRELVNFDFDTTLLLKPIILHGEASKYGKWPSAIKNIAKMQSSKTSVEKTKKSKTKTKANAKTNAKTKAKLPTSYTLEESSLVFISLQALAVKPSTKVDLILGIHWDRIIVSDAHILHVRMSNRSQVILKLRSTITWLMTDMPITRSLEDMQGLIEMFQIPGFNQQFWENISQHLAPYGNKPIQTSLIPYCALFFAFSMLISHHSREGELGNSTRSLSFINDDRRSTSFTSSIDSTVSTDSSKSSKSSIASIYQTLSNSSNTSTNGSTNNNNNNNNNNTSSIGMLNFTRTNIEFKTQAEKNVYYLACQNWAESVSSTSTNTSTGTGTGTEQKTSSIVVSRSSNRLLECLRRLSSFEERQCVPPTNYLDSPELIRQWNDLMTYASVIIEKESDQVALFDSTDTCSICLSAPQIPTQTPCLHVFCKICILRSMEKQDPVCPMCRTKITREQLTLAHFKEETDAKEQESKNEMEKKEKKEKKEDISSLIEHDDSRETQCTDMNSKINYLLDRFSKIQTPHTLHTSYASHSSHTSHTPDKSQITGTIILTQYPTTCRALVQYFKKCTELSNIVFMSITSSHSLAQRDKKLHLFNHSQNTTGKPSVLITTSQLVSAGLAIGCLNASIILFEPHLDLQKETYLLSRISQHAAANRDRGSSNTNSNHQPHLNVEYLIMSNTLEGVICERNWNHYKGTHSSL